MIWSYGVTTVSDRRDTLLPRTLASLRKAGFESPRLFVDGSKDIFGWERQFGLETTTRSTNLKTFGNWILALWELLIRNPKADRYALFQDDIVMYFNTRQYLDRCQFSEKGYWNLYTFMENEVVPKYNKQGWHESVPLDPKQGGVYYHGKPQQGGRSATALVFNRNGVLTLLGSPILAAKPLHAKFGTNRVDGGIVETMNQAGYREYVHNPSLVQHTGEVSSMGHNRAGVSIYHPAHSFKGEDFNAMDLLVQTTSPR